MSTTRDYPDGRAASTRSGRLSLSAPQVKDGLPLEASDLARQFVLPRDTLYGYVFALTRDHDLAEDILQDVGVSILTETARVSGPGDFISWARGIARNRAADHFRRVAIRRQHEMPFEAFADAVDLAFDENVRTPEDNRQQIERMRECLDELTARVRSMIDMRYNGNKSMNEIALSLSWTPASIKVALSRARRTLADCVDRKLHLEEKGIG